MRCRPYSFKREAVEAPVSGFARKAAYRDILEASRQIAMDDSPLSAGATDISSSTALTAHSPGAAVRPHSIRCPKATAKRAASDSG